MIPSIWQTVVHAHDAAGRQKWSIPLGAEGIESGHGIAGSSADLWVVGQSSPRGGGSRVLVARLAISSGAAEPVHH